jgi:hypothetical protein
MPGAFNLIFQPDKSIYGYGCPEVSVVSGDQRRDGEVPARYISAEDLITNKLASGRMQDLADVEAIRHRQRAVKSD